MNKQFLEDVKIGLSSQPKFLSSRYFYDKVGDKLFVDIMNMPEYYLTDAEHEILKQQSEAIIVDLNLQKNTFFELIELGAGDGTKTKELLNILLADGYNFEYIPIDISQNALDNLEQCLHIEIPHLKVKTQQGDYFKILASLKDSHHPKVVLFLGSNMGNLLDHEAQAFIYHLGENLNANDKLFLGVDLIKSEEIVLPAYNDAANITANFNLNILERINREFDADFNTELFEHKPEYTEKEGIAKSYLVSTVEQEIEVKALNKTFTFLEGEKIHTEISRKYNDTVINNILQGTDFKVIAKRTDSKNLFADYILNRA